MSGFGQFKYHEYYGLAKAQVFDGNTKMFTAELRYQFHDNAYFGFRLLENDDSFVKSSKIILIGSGFGGTGIDVGIDQDLNVFVRGTISIF